MFLIPEPVPGSARPVYCLRDPRPDGFEGDVEENVELDTAGLADTSWTSVRLPGSVLARDPDNWLRCRLFRSVAEAEAGGWQVVGPSPVVVFRWSEELRQALIKLTGS